MDNMFVFIDYGREFKVAKTVCNNNDTYTDIHGNEYPKDNIKYTWIRSVPVENPNYVKKHLLLEEVEECQELNFLW